MKKGKFGSCISIRVRLLGGGSGWIDPDPREGGNPSRKRRIRKEIIFGQATHFTSSGA